MTTQTPEKYTLDESQLLNTFVEMVKIDSPSGHEEKMCTYLQERFKSLGLIFEVEKHSGNLIVDVPAHECAHDNILILSGHMDVVPPCEGIQPKVETLNGDTIISSDNTTVLGADDKAGLAPIIEAVTYSLENNLPRPRCRLVLTTKEEVGLQGAKELDDKYLTDAGFSVIFDHTGKQGTIINQAPTYVHFTITFMGKSVHAGIMPEKGVNAIHFASECVMDFKEAGLLGRVDDDTTSNLGIFTGGKGTNVVPDEVVLQGEIRGHNKAVLEKYLSQFKTILKNKKTEWQNNGKAEADFNWHQKIEFHGYKIDPKHPGIEGVVKAAENCGLMPEYIRTNGGSDNNVFVLRGTPGVVLSAGYVEPHTLKERVKLSEMVTCTRFILSMLTHFSSHSFQQK